MPNKNYIRGRAYEYEVMKEFEDHGYIAYRTAGSHGKYDIIAIGKDFIYLVQCKTKLVNRMDQIGQDTKEEESYRGRKYSIIAERRTKYIRRRGQ